MTGKKNRLIVFISSFLENRPPKISYKNITYVLMKKHFVGKKTNATFNLGKKNLPKKPFSLKKNLIVLKCSLSLYNNYFFSKKN